MRYVAASYSVVIDINTHADNYHNIIVLEYVPTVNKNTMAGFSPG